MPIGENATILLPSRIAKYEELRATVRLATQRVASICIEAVEAGQKNIDASFGKALKIAVNVISASGEARSVHVGFGDATDKETRYKEGMEILGIEADWKLPSHFPEGPLRAVWQLDPPISLADGEKLQVVISGDCSLPLRIATSPCAARTPFGIDGDALKRAFATAVKDWTPAQKNLVAETWLLSTTADLAAYHRVEQLVASLRETRDGKAWTMITRAVEPLAVRVLPRGNWQDQSGPMVLPATPSFLPGRVESTETHRLTRLDLARYITSKENPITARAVTNRLWQQFFGGGLSATLDDLGSQGEPPSHPELLDWIASEFRDSGWDFKHVIKLFVTSATYRQNSGLRPELREIDSANRLLASQNPRRLEAEFIRDNALFIAGILDTKEIGGPSVYPYQPPGYYDALQFPDRDYAPSTGPEQWRRGVYMHWQRTFLHPMLANFDAPARDECAAARVASNTPQQALTLLNDPTFVEAARLFAGRVLSSGAHDDGARLDHAFQLTVALTPKEREKEALEKFLAAQRDYYREHVEDANKLLKVGYAPPTEGESAEAAAWTNVCRVLLNSQEAITRY